MQQKRSTAVIWVFLVFGVIIGWFLHGFFTDPVIKTIKVPIKAKTEIKTVIKYIPKENAKDVDVDIQIPAQKIKVKINDKVTEIQKTDNEEYIFDKNKLQLNQNSQLDLNIHVPVIRKRWGAGIGYSVDSNSEAYLIKFPVSKKNLDGWIFKSNKDIAAGVMIGF